MVKWLSKLFKRKEKVYCEECRHYSVWNKMYSAGCNKIIKYKPSIYRRQDIEINASPEFNNMFNHCKYYESDKEENE